MLKYMIGAVLALGLTFAEARAAPNSSAPLAPSICGSVTLSAGTASSNIALPISSGNCTATTILNDGTVEAFVEIGTISVSASVPTPGVVSKIIAIPPGQSAPTTSGGSAGTYVAAITATGSTTLRIYQANGSVPFTGGAGNGESSGGTVIATQPVGSLLHMTCDSGCSSSTAPADESPFTPAVTSQTPIGGYYPATPTTAPLTAGQMGAVQLTQYRALHVDLHNASGVEVGTPSAPIQVSLANTGFNVNSLSVIANAGSNLNTSLLALESGGNLANVSSAVVAAVMQDNVKQIASSPVAVGAGGPTGGTMRVAEAQDTTTIAGSAPGTAGAASSNVVSVQGISGMTPLTVAQTVGSNLHIVCDSGCSSSTAPADETAFTPGTTSQTPIGGFYQITGTNNPLTNGQMGAVQLTANRALFTNPRNSSGVEIGTASTPIQVSVANTTVNGTSMNVALTSTLPAFAATPTVNLGTLNGAATAANQEVTAAGTTATSAQGVQGVTGGVPMPVSGTVTATQTVGSNLHIVCDSGCSSSTAPADEATFTPGTTSQTPVGGFYQTTATSNPLTTGQMGAIQLTQYRAGMVNLRTAAGAEIGTAASPIQVSVANTAANVTAMVVTANAGTNLNTSALALESGGNLATVAGAVTSAVMQENLKQVGATTVLTGAGAVGTGAQRMAVGQDTTTIAGSAPGTAGSASAQVVSVQGVSGGVVLPVSLASVPLPTGAATAANQTTANTSLATIATNTGAAIPAGANIIGALTANQSINLSQVGGSSTATSATGVQKVGVVGNAGAAMDFAGQNATTPANAMQIGGQYNSSPTTITSGNSSPLQLDNAGNLKVNVNAGGTLAQGASASGAQGSLVLGISSGNLTGLIQADSSVPIAISTATTTQLVALASGKKIYITAWDVIAAGTGNIELEYGTGTNCGTGTTALTGNYNLTAQVGLTKGSGMGPILEVPASNALCALTSAAVGMAGSVSFTQF